MLLMLAVLAAVFFVAIVAMCIYRHKLDNPLINRLFLVATAVTFFAWNYAGYELGWLKDGFMTLENISPFICTVILLTPFMRGKVRDYAYSCIAFLALGMFLALFISPSAEYLAEYTHRATFVYAAEASCHLVMALYGLYLVLSGKVGLELRDMGKGVTFIYAAILYGVFLNLCFHRSNFGMNMYGRYRIYFLEIFGSFEATLLAYLAGVLATVAGGFLFALLIDWVARGTRVKAEAVEPVFVTEA